MSYLQQLNTLYEFFKTGQTQPYLFRKEQLQKLRNAILQHEEEIYAALYTDLKKCAEECWVTENGLAIAEINHALCNLKKWMRPQRKCTNLVNFLSSSFVMREPLGVVLLIAPWNYPFQLLMKPLIAAIAGGNCVVLKPSEHAPATAAVMKAMVEEIFPPHYILYVEGEGKSVLPQMMQQFVFDHVFFTGSPAVGKEIYKMAAENLVPVTLELGGKSPCVVDADADVVTTAKRIAVTKFTNAGQMCVAPDYVLVHRSQKAALVEELKKYIIQFFGEDAAAHYNYCKIINENQFDRIVKYLDEGNVIFGGKYNRSKLFIAPTLLDELSLQSAVMEEEIFGPILPIIAFDDKQQALEIIEANKNPLAFYIFAAHRQNAMQWLRDVASGGACINNASWHFANHYLPAGGRGKSGMGNYHGKYGFDTFTHPKGVLKSPNWFDPKLKYPPFKGRLNLFKKIIR